MDTDGAGSFKNQFNMLNSIDDNLHKDRREGAPPSSSSSLPRHLHLSFIASLLVSLLFDSCLGGNWTYSLPVSANQMYMVVLYAYEHEYNYLGNRAFDVFINWVRQLLWFSQPSTHFSPIPLFVVH